MDQLEQLSQKVHKVADQISSLKRERDQLLTEVETLRQAKRDQQRINRENEQLHRLQDRLRGKLEKLNQKIDKHLVTQEPMMISSGGEIHE